MLWHGKLTLFQFGGQIFIPMHFLPLDEFCGALKIDMEEEDCVIIIPVWKSQVWFTKLISLLVDVPVLLPRKANLLHHPLQTDNVHPILSHSHLAACRLSGKSFKVQAFQRTLSTLSSPPGVPAHDVNMPSTCGSGLRCVLNDKKIPFRRLHKL